ncbi:MAG TPA: hypothetical protein VIC32_10095 [Terriglobales bacterium]|jgi:hypothetical protein
MFRLALTSLFLAASVPAMASHATFIRPVQQTIPAAGITQVALENLVGPISVQTSAEGPIQLVVLIHSGGADDAFARALSQQLNFTVKNENGQLRIIGNYPLEHFRDYGYPHMRGIMGIHGTTSNEYDGKKVFIHDVGSKKAVELWAEVRLTVPANINIAIRNTYGDVELRGGGDAASTATLDGFTDVGDFSVYRPVWGTLKLQSDYGKVEFTDGLGVGKDIYVNTDVGGTYLDLPPQAQGKIIAHKDLGFLHNDVSAAKFTKDADGNSVLQLGDGAGPSVHIEMSVGSLHLQTVGGGN